MELEQELRGRKRRRTNSALNIEGREGKERRRELRTRG
jgi:hypothetical protein